MKWRFWPLLILAVSSLARAEEEKTLEQKVLETGDKIQKRIETTAEKIDITLAGKKYTRKPNSTRAELRQLVSWSEGGKVKTSTDVGLNLRLPNVERRWQLRFSSYDEQQESRDVNNQRVRTRPHERNYGAGLFFFEKLGRIKTSFLPRVQLKDPLEVNYTLRFEVDSGATPIKVIPRVDLFADPKKGTGEFAQLEFGTELTDRLGASLINTEEYDEKNNFFTTQHVLTLDYSLNEKQALGYSLGFVSHNRSHFHLDTYTVSTAFTQRVYPDRLTASLSPFLVFAKSVGFKGNAGISLTLELVL